MKWYSCSCLLGMLLWPQLVWGNDLFHKMVTDFAEQSVKDFVGFVAEGERYPLMHMITQSRFKILAAYLKINKPKDTKICSDRRNKKIENVPVEQQDFCQRYDDTIDGAKNGVSDMAIFEKIYFKLEPLLLREIEIQEAREPMKKWIEHKIKCFKEKAKCGKDEKGMIERVTKWEPNLIRLYKHLLENLEKKLFPEATDIAFLDKNVLDSPCSISGKIGEMLIDKGMVFISGGTFIMGSDKGRPDEKTAHAVNLEAFWIDRCEVTNIEYLRYVAKDPHLRKSTFPRQFHDGDYLTNWGGDLKPPSNRDNYPVTYVSWFAARYFCQSIGKRLPSEAEWEKSTRAGTFTDYALTPSAKLTDYAWYNENAESNAHLVADRLPNKFQLYDMQGNVWEWVYDWYAMYPKGRAENPQGPSLGKYRVLRGGSWMSPASHLRVSMRGDDSPVNTSQDVGFRCAASTHPEGGRLKN
ncbi:MAG: SUMF1/EgtB/PvdO family nonheme iron enzyme [SAR324 cluster bacterium]|nr:SUMF1/EgtB/PvdO family nonheme iron enzyme [SAR324 cluster bacterium]